MAGALREATSPQSRQHLWRQQWRATIKTQPARGPLLDPRPHSGGTSPRWEEDQEPRKPELTAPRAAGHGCQPHGPPSAAKGQAAGSSGNGDRSYMRLTEKEDETLPIDIVLQTLLAFAVTCYGIVHIAGEFKDMDATSELKNKTFDTLRNHPSFYVFNHRGRVLFQSPDTVNSSNQDALSSSSSLKFRKLEPLRR
ncbi:ER membrane protein complex subunit 5 isoform X2 [Anser cygnoides]|uniref:ER membrane protein complex subunit 5 isoform X2 n=1 Tax=Anser cygnoides TaxID=8845 RepID=UPI0034D2E437